MKLIVNPHKITLKQEEAVNEKEIDISKCEFEFADEITSDYVKEAYFTLGDNTYKQVIVNNECSFPQEVLVKPATIELGVVAYLVEDEEEIKRYNPTPVYFKTDLGSLKTAQNSQPITPSEMEQYEQALQEGLTEVANVDIDASKVDDTATITITDRTGTQKSVEIKDGADGEKGDPFTYADFTPEQLASLTGPAGQDGRDGAIQYTAGDNITIENNVISATGGDLSNYYTKTEVDSKLAIIPTYYLDLENTNNFGGTVNVTSTNVKTNMGKILTDAYAKGFRFINLVLTKNTGKEAITLTYTDPNDNSNNQNIQSKPTYLILKGIDSTVEWSIYYDNIRFHQMNLDITWSGNVATVTTMKITTNQKNFLPTDNTRSYTPASNYHPATKKYVDDSIASAITDALGGNY